MEMPGDAGVFWFVAFMVGSVIANIPPFITSLAAWRRSRSTDERVPRLIEELRDEIRVHQREPFHPGSAYQLEVLQRRLDELERLAKKMAQKLDDGSESR